MITAKIIPLSLDYTIKGKDYHQTYDYYWEIPSIEKGLPTATYEQELSGQPFIVQYNPNNPKELLAVVEPNELSTFEAFAQFNFKKNVLNILAQWALFLAVAAVYSYYW